jgi:hypothetical protein
MAIVTTGVNLRHLIKKVCRISFLSGFYRTYCPHRLDSIGQRVLNILIILQQQSGNKLEAIKTKRREKKLLDRV